MKKALFILSLSLITVTKLIAQQGYGCAIVFFYDAAGNQVQRQYFCGNLDITGGKAALVSTVPQAKDVEITKIASVYPNPTTGRFSIVFGKELKDATIQIIDMNGKPIQQRKTTGSIKEDFDISNVAAGTYFLRVINKENIITQKIIKQ